jgi:hypothetical protein
MRITPFSFRIEAEVLADLRERIRNTRWPDPAPGAAWEQGTDLEYLRICSRTGPTGSTGARRSSR